MSPAGLGDAFKDWLPDREEAERKFFEPDTSDQQKPDASKGASNNASEDASVDADREGEESQTVTLTADGGSPPPPPPARRSAGRVQFNHRIRADRDKLLQKYKNKHGSTMQGLVDQMVDEYLQRRGLLPKHPTDSE